MPRTDLSPVFEALAIAADADTPLHRQLYEELRQAILDGRLSAGARLPSTRALAARLHLSRNTVLGAFAQLLAEGYLEGRVGSGTYVARALPDDLLEVRGAPSPPGAAHGGRRGLSKRGRVIAGARAGAALHPAPEPSPFRIGRPDLDHFPFERWARLSARRWRHATAALVSYGDPAGYAPLREAIAGHLHAARGVKGSAAQVILTAGSQQALDLAARLLLDPEDAVWIEDPGYLGARGIFRAAGARLVPVRVDDEGIDVAAGVRAAPAARLAYVTPSHQYPLGMTMSLARRFALLDWAARHDAWIVEDDYDSEFRYAGRPIASLQSLDTSGRVIYVGTFSKVLIPGVRVGYLVVPPRMVEAFLAGRALVDQAGPGVTHAILADFIAEGDYARHLRRMRALYAGRQRLLLDVAAAEMRGVLDVPARDGGMTLVGWLPPGVDGEEASRAALARGVEVTPVSRFCLKPLARHGLALGYAGLESDAIRTGLRQLREALEPLVAATRSPACATRAGGARRSSR
jgi:GntR family transcriptional regulator/MocR family aminotransferase